MLNFFPGVDEIKPQDVFSRLNDRNEIFLLDVREPNEYDHIRIDNCVLIPRGTLESGSTQNYEKESKSLEEAKNKEVVVICRSGVRSLYAAQYLKQKGFQNVKSMATGVMGWAQNGYPVSGKILQQA